MGNGRFASLPLNGGHHRPETLVGLVVSHVNEKGTGTARYDFSSLPLSPQFQLELATVFAARANPTGKWRNLPSSKQGFWAVGYFARWLAAQERVPTSIADLDPATWLQWRLSQLNLSTSGRRAVRLSSMLVLESELLTNATRHQVIKRIPRDTAQELSYDDSELRQIAVAARHVFRGARDRVLRNLEHLRRYRAKEFAPDSQDFLVGKALEFIANDADVPRRMKQKDHPPVSWVAQALGGGHREQTWKRLYLDDVEIWAAAVLVACKEGWNQTTIAELKVPELVDSESRFKAYRIELEKRRRRPPHRYESRTIVDNAPDSTARLLERIIEITQPARDCMAAHGIATDRLLVSHRAYTIGLDPTEMFEEGIGSHASRNFATLFGHSINMRRIRKAVNTRHHRAPNQNTRDTHDAVYLLTDAHVIKDAEAVIAEGVERAIVHAKTTAAVNQVDADMGEDTPTASCVDTTKSPFSPWGVPCTASFLLCLACSNAVVMPRHLGRLAYLFECLSNRRDTLSPTVWAAEWATHYSRLHQLRTEHYSEGQWTQALDGLGESDRSLVDHLLCGDLDS